MRTSGRVLVVLLGLVGLAQACPGRPPKPPRHCPEVICRCEGGEGGMVVVQPAVCPAAPACIYPTPPPTPQCRHCRLVLDRRGNKKQRCRQCTIDVEG